MSTVRNPLSPHQRSRPIRRSPKVLSALLLLVALSLSACTPAQISSWFAQRGHPVSAPVAQALSTYALSEQARNDRAIYAAFHSGSRGTCTPTGIVWAESGGRWDAQNPSSSASGIAQFIRSTWANHRGYPEAWVAPPWVQWEKFMQVWAGGAGRGHWSANPVC